LFCLDTVMMDIVMTVSRVPAAGSDVLAERGMLTTGGGFNCMSSAARQGMPVVYAGKLGTGPFSTLARQSLDAELIRAPIVSDPITDAGFCVVIVDGSGERTFLTSRGAEGALHLSDLRDLDARDGDYVLLSGYNVMYPVLAEMVLAWITGLDEGVVVAFDPSNRVYDIPSQYLQSALARADWLLCNEIEALHLTGLDSSPDSVVALGRLTGRGNAVVRHGATGCTVVHRCSDPEVVDGFAAVVVDTNGAGDTHNGVFIAELARGSAVANAARRANIAASVAISSLGPATCPTRDEIDERMAQWSDRLGG
jgi:sugar/nucleoside kinase (ribokinase family)